jgi:adenylate kinase family enzyme
MKLVVSGFPGVGKSTLYEKAGQQGIWVQDSDSSHFPKEGFPENYLDHIEHHWRVGPGVLMVSSHQLVRDGMVKRQIPYVLVYPSRDCKQEYLERYTKRGSPSAFVKTLDENWDQWIAECEQQLGCTRRVLQSGQFLSDALGF